MSGCKPSFRKFAEDQKKILATKYPFLKPAQIHRKAVALWAKLPDEERAYFTLPAKPRKSKSACGTTRPRTTIVTAKKRQQVNTPTHGKSRSWQLDWSSPEAQQDFWVNKEDVKETYSNGCIKPQTFYEPPPFVEDVHTEMQGILVSPVGKKKSSSKVSFEDTFKSSANNGSELTEETTEESTPRGRVMNDSSDDEDDAEGALMLINQQMQDKAEINKAANTKIKMKPSGQNNIEVNMEASGNAETRSTNAHTDVMAAKLPEEEACVPIINIGVNTSVVKNTSVPENIPHRRSLRNIKMDTLVAAAHPENNLLPSIPDFEPSAPIVQAAVHSDVKRVTRKKQGLCKEEFTPNSDRVAPRSMNSVKSAHQREGMQAIECTDETMSSYKPAAALHENTPKIQLSTPDGQMKLDPSEAMDVAGVDDIRDAGMHCMPVLLPFPDLEALSDSPSSSPVMAPSHAAVLGAVDRAVLAMQQVVTTQYQQAPMGDEASPGTSISNNSIDSQLSNLSYLGSTASQERDSIHSGDELFKPIKIYSPRSHLKHSSKTLTHQPELKSVFMDYCTSISPLSKSSTKKVDDDGTPRGRNNCKGNIKQEVNTAGSQSKRRSSRKLDMNKVESEVTCPPKRVDLESKDEDLDGKELAVEPGDVLSNGKMPPTSASPLVKKLVSLIGLSSDQSDAVGATVAETTSLTEPKQGAKEDYTTSLCKIAPNRDSCSIIDDLVPSNQHNTKRGIVLGLFQEISPPAKKGKRRILTSGQGSCLNPDSRAPVPEDKVFI